jgi:hypothetical protein
MHRLLLLLVLSALGAVPAAADAPEFADYPAPVYSGKVAKPILDTADKREYRTRLNAAAKRRPDVAGQYILATWGCGTTCVAGAVLNARSGVVTFLPAGVCCWDGDEEPLHFTVDSHLIALVGMLNEEEPKGTHYFVLDEDRFTPLPQ